MKDTYATFYSQTENCEVKRMTPIYLISSVWIRLYEMKGIPHNLQFPSFLGFQTFYQTTDRQIESVANLPNLCGHALHLSV